MCKWILPIFLMICVAGFGSEACGQALDNQLFDNQHCTSKDDSVRMRSCTEIINSSKSTAGAKAAAHLNVGIIYAKRGQYALAVREDDQAIALMPSIGGFYGIRALNLHKLGKEEKALDDKRKMQQLDPRLTVDW